VIDERPTVAHLVSPYLFLTGSWIHSQLLHARKTRPIVITQSVENRALFPFEPVHDLSPHARGIRKPGFLGSKFLLGRYPERPYRRILDQEAVRVLHAHLGWEGARTHGLAERPRRPFVVSFYGRDATLLARHPYWKALYRRLFRRADRVLAEGSFMAGTLRSIGAPPDRVRVVHLGVDPSTFPFRERTPSERVIGLISGSFREK
jgi:glycosyltransferase involved in cell wall biosynthesis